MNVKNVNLETVCGITSILPENQPGSGLCRKIQRGKIITDQRADEPQILCTDVTAAGKNPDHQFL